MARYKGPYRMTPARRAALRKAQLASARKRRKRRIAVTGTIGGIAITGSLVARHKYSDSSIVVSRRQPVVRHAVTGRRIFSLASVTRNRGVPYSPIFSKTKKQIKLKRRYRHGDRRPLPKVKLADRGVVVNVRTPGRHKQTSIYYLHKPMFKGNKVAKGIPQGKGRQTKDMTKVRPAHAWHQGSPYYLKTWRQGED
jgi:hypothetical protein